MTHIRQHVADELHQYCEAEYATIRTAIDSKMKAIAASSFETFGKETLVAETAILILQGATIQPFIDSYQHFRNCIHHEISISNILLLICKMINEAKKFNRMHELQGLLENMLSIVKGHAEMESNTKIIAAIEQALAVS